MNKIITVLLSTINYNEYLQNFTHPFYFKFYMDFKIDVSILRTKEFSKSFQ